MCIRDRSKEIPLVVNNKIMSFLDSETDGNSAYNNRRGTLTLGFLQRMCFDVNKGQSYAEVNSDYIEKKTSDPPWVAQFDKMMTLFNTYTSSVLRVIGTASQTFAGSASDASESNIDLAGNRAATGVNFYISEFNKKYSGALEGSASYNTSNNTLSLLGEGTERIVVINGGITNTDTVIDDFYTDQCIYFKLLR